MGFFIGVAESIVAALILLGIGTFASRKFRVLLTDLLGRILRIDIEYVYSNIKEAEKDIGSELNRTSSVDLFTSRGHDLQANPFSPLLRNGAPDPKFRVLLPSTQVGTEYSWVNQREEELGPIDSAFGRGLLSEQIDGTVRFLQSYIEAGKVELRRYNHPHIGRVLITDNVVFVTPYQNRRHGRDCEVIKLRRIGPLSGMFVRMFEQLWQAGSTPSSVQDPVTTSGA